MFRVFTSWAFAILFLADSLNSYPIGGSIVGRDLNSRMKFAPYLVLDLTHKRSQSTHIARGKALPAFHLILSQRSSVRDATRWKKG
jgi:hypothetical protein